MNRLIAIGSSNSIAMLRHLRSAEVFTESLQNEMNEDSLSAFTVPTPIILMRVPEGFGLKHKFKTLLKISASRTRLKFVCIYASEFPVISGSRMADFLRRLAVEIDDKRTIYYFYRFRKTGRLRVSGRILLEVPRIDTRDKVRIKSRASLFTMKNRINLSKISKRESLHAFLKLQYQGTVVGDLAASHALRYDARAGGSLGSSRYRYRCLRHAVEMIELLKLLQLDSKDAVILAEKTYLHSVPRRFIKGKNVGIIDSNWQNIRFTMDDPFESLGAIDSSPNVQRSPEDLRLIESWLARRIDSHDVLSYMRGIGSSKDSLRSTGMASVDKSRGSLLTKDSSQKSDPMTAVVYLHSFSDAQYSFGHDGFIDIYDWVTFTIDSILKYNPDWNVHVKGHPNEDYSWKLARHTRPDHYAMKRLKRRYASSGVEFLDVSQKLSKLEPSKSIILTHHGSVASEAIFLKIPCLYSSTAPWWPRFNFGKSWSSIDEYLELIRNLTSIRNSGVDVSEYEQMLDYEFCRFREEETLSQKLPFRNSLDLTSGGDDFWRPLAKRLRELEPNSMDLVYAIELADQVFKGARRN